MGGCVQRRGRFYRRLLQHDTGGGRIRRVPPDQAKDRCMGELGYVLPGLGEGPRGRQVATRRLRSEGGRRRCLRASALARVARQQGRRHPSRRLLRELPQRAVRILWQFGGDEPHRGLGSDYKVEAWDLTTDGACESDRPEGEKKNKKWHAPDCSAVTMPAAHPFKKP